MDDGAGRAAHAPRGHREAAGTWSGSSRHTVLPPAVWHTRLPVPDLKSSPSAGGPGPGHALPGKAHGAETGATDPDTLDVAFDDGIPRLAPHPMPGMLKPTPRSGRGVRPHVSYVVVVGRRTGQGDAQDLGGFFLDLEDGVRLFQPSPQPRVFLAQLLVLDGDLVATTPLGSPRPG